MKKLIIFCALFVFAGTAFPQFGMYESLSAGYNENVMNNYQHQGDRALQNYLEMNYTFDKDTSKLVYSYAGSLQMFDALTARNYYEHGLSVNYGRVFLSKENRIKKVITQIAEAAVETDSTESEDSTTVEDSSDESGDVSSSASHDKTLTVNIADDLKKVISAVGQEVLNVMGEFDDSTNAYLNLGATVGARHDKNIYKEYDNQLFKVSGSWRDKLLSSGGYYTVSDAAEIRNYSYLDALSNVTNTLRLQIGNTRSNSFNYSILASLGNKYFLTSDYDTTLFTKKKNLDTTSGSGKGKGGAVSSGNSSNKTILVTGNTMNLWQVSYGASGEVRWGSGDASLTALSRVNLGNKKARYLAQYANTGLLTEDIYNDSFNYHGYEAILDIHQKLPFDCRLQIQGTIAKKYFGVEALTLKGAVSAAEREDITSLLEMTLAKKIKISGDLDAEVFINTTLLRNQSNDQYNDFSSSVVDFGVGIGF